MSEEQRQEVSGALKRGEPHPAAKSAYGFIKSMPDIWQWMETFASNAIEGDRISEICGETLDRILSCKPVSDRYLLGLAWTIRSTLDTQSVLFDRRELATVLAALRFWQDTMDGGEPPAAYNTIATDLDRLDPLNTDEIDALCERVNQ